MKCGLSKEDKECDIKCQYYHTCTRSEYRKKEYEDGRKEILLAKTPKRFLQKT